MITCTKILPFDAGHRLLDHLGPCRFVHGHRYSAEVTVEAPELNELGMVIDFGVIKEKVGGWINSTLDHNFLAHPYDPLLDRSYPEVIRLLGREPYVFPEHTNPTAENIAELIFNKSVELLPKELKVVNVRLFETPTSYADYSENKSGYSFTESVDNVSQQVTFKTKEELEQYIKSLAPTDDRK